MKKLSKKLKLLLWISAAIIVLVVFCIWQNNSLVVSNFVYHNSKIPVDFNNYKCFLQALSVTKCNAKV